MANDVTDAMDLIAEALTDFYGERCPDVHPGCHCCEAWAQYDALAARPEPEGMETADEDIAILNRVAEVGILGTDPARVGRFVRDFDRLSAEVASLKARLAAFRDLAPQAEAAFLDATQWIDLAKRTHGDDNADLREANDCVLLAAASYRDSLVAANERVLKAEAEEAAAVAAEREQCALIALSVRDTGGGIAAEKVARAIRARGGEHG